jgi:hypothetical protein
MSFYRSTTYSMPTPQPSEEAIQAAAAEAQAVRDAGAADPRNYVRRASDMPHETGLLDLGDLEYTTPGRQRLNIREKLRQHLPADIDSVTGDHA